VQKVENVEDVLFIWVGQVNAKNVAATDDIKEQASKSTWTADECDKFCTQKLICILLQKVRLE
jgi:hypothetical protein